MKPNIMIGVVVIVVACVAALVLSRSVLPAPLVIPTVTTPTTTAVVSPKATVRQPTFASGTTTVTTTPAFAHFDATTVTSSSTYPTLTGTANSTKVGIVINNSTDIGIVGTWEIPVVNGRWSYSSSVALPAGTYHVLLFSGPTQTDTVQLTIVR